MAADEGGSLQDSVMEDEEEEEEEEPPTQELKLIQEYPIPPVLRCDVCSCCYNLHSSLVRHMREQHGPTTETWRCRECKKDFNNKRGVTTHFNKTHPSIVDEPEELTSNRYACSFCPRLFASAIGLGNHTRTHHQPEVSQRNATASLNPRRQKWSTEEHELFITALHRFGSKSNKKIVAMMGSRTANQVNQYKSKYLKQHPELKNLRGTEQTDSNSCDSPSPSVSSRNEDAPSPLSLGSTLSDDALIERLQQLDKDLNSVELTNPPTLPTPHSVPPPPSPLDLWDVEQERTTPPPLPRPLNQGDRPTTPPPLPPPLNQGDLPLAEEINRVITTCRQLTEDTRQQNHTPQLCNTSRNSNPQQPTVHNQHPRNNPSQSNDYLKKLRKETEDELQCYLQEDISTVQWTAFETCINKLSKKLSNLQTHKPQQRHPNPSRHYYQRQRQFQRQNEVRNHQRHRTSGHQRNIIQARKLQNLYRHQRPKAIRQILQETEGPRCKIPLSSLEDHFKQTYSTQHHLDEAPDFLPPTPPNRMDVLEDPILPGEVKQQLKRLPAKSAPGPDKITYHTLKMFDPEGTILAAIFEICRRAKRIPTNWKSSQTIFIHKKGDTNNVRNWRPINLQATQYKIYAAIIARRLASWAIDNKAFSPNQKGFLPVDGCLEHTFLLQSILQHSRRKRKNVSMVWLDLQDAFGSIPHTTLFTMIERAGLDNPTIDIIKDIYDNSTVKIKTDEGLSTPITITKGVKQGCPLSPILFNFVIEGAIAAIHSTNDGFKIGDNATIKSLAYADDLCIITDNKDKLNKIPATLERFTTWAGLTFAVHKCASLSCINNTTRRYVDPYSPTLLGNPIPAMKWEDHYKYLGCQLGANPKAELQSLAEQFMKCNIAILNSQLTDWQKLDAIHTFTKPKLDHALRTLLSDRTWANKLDRRLRGLVKKSLKLPNRTTTAFFYTSHVDGGLGLPCILNEMDVARVTTATKLLSSKDPTVKQVALHQLQETATKRQSTTPDSLEDFLNSPPREGEGRCGDIRTLWSLCRTSLKHTNSTLHLSPDEEAWIESADSLRITDNKKIAPHLKDNLKDQWLKNLCAAPDQGRAFPAISKDPSSNHWIKNGNFTSFSTYRFGLKARLNLLPTKTTQQRAGQNSHGNQCRQCHEQPETLAHILNHCPPFIGLMRSRHNNILKRLIKAIPSSVGQKFSEQEVPGDDRRLKPDLVIKNEDSKTALIVDVTTPFDLEDNLAKARKDKEDKYAYLIPLLKAQGFDQVSTHAFVVGSLGSWDPENEQVLKILKINRSYARLFRKLCCSDALADSHTIWRIRCSR